MGKLPVIIFSILLLAIGAFSQEAKKVGEFGYFPCDQFVSVMDSFYRYAKTDIHYPDSKIVIIFYGAEYRKVTVPGFDGNDFIKTAPPIRGDARSRALDIPVYLTHKFGVPNERIELIDGGFREEFEFELWLVSGNAKKPKPTPAIDVKTITFVDLKPSKTRNCSNISNPYEMNEIKKVPNEALPFDQFGIIPCGDFMARMAALYSDWQRSDFPNIYIVYYGGMYRKDYSNWNEQTRTYNKMTLQYAHRNDGLNWAKTTYQYLTKVEPYKNKLSNRVFLLDGGYRSNIEVELWIVPKGAASPSPTNSIDAKKLKFRKNNPIRTRNYNCCYCNF